ncbi:hypothetical protein ACER0A_013765 [Haloimpatiens sp. FM7315]|uniref:hypothetical protein n=1 Tax=Haloimpatiens sp. FM7315 TaxID=3298609 RepID=UPI00370C77E9
MKIKLFNEKGHLTVEAMSMLKNGELNEKNLILTLEHIEKCSICAGKFAGSFEEEELVETPLGFEETLESKIENKIENKKYKSKKISNIKFAFYCTKIAVAASIALIIVFSNKLNFIVNGEKSYVKPLDLSFVNSISSELNDFSERIIKLEVLKDDKKEK